jgi:hypothetical protein
VQQGRRGEGVAGFLLGDATRRERRRREGRKRGRSLSQLGSANPEGWPDRDAVPIKQCRAPLPGTARTALQLWLG